MTCADRAGQPLEEWADHFARALLMPAEIFAALNEDGWDVVKMANYFDVPLEQAIRRRKELNLKGMNHGSQ